ncbi:ATP-binding protein [Actinacidiphila glaucinigra]|uniref:ATP-binding protein n=1 Tax=Actinacidiphila glaucinigra TaxID=235986 RepID=UPI0035DC5225
MTNHAALHHRHLLTLPTEPAAVAVARKTAEYVYAAWGVNPGHPAFAPALLILSELVTNSVRHAAEASPSLDVIYAAGAGVLAFAVHDRHPHRPDLVTPAKPGGGLALVAELTAEHAGTATIRPDADAGGKSIWITLPLQ